MAGRSLLYYITDRSQFAGNELARRRALLAKIAEAVRAGVDYIQLREKDLSTRELETLAREAVSVLRQNQQNHYPPSTRLLINSRTDVALATGADGVHLRSGDVSSEDVRQVVGQTSGSSKHDPSGVKARSLSGFCGTAEAVPFPKPIFEASCNRFLIAVSCHSKEDVLRAASERADFVVFAPVFEKRDHPAGRSAGLAALREACLTKIPVLALGGVNLENAASCLDAGAAGIAAIRLFQENRIEDVVRALRAL